MRRFAVLLIILSIILIPAISTASSYDGTYSAWAEQELKTAEGYGLTFPAVMSQFKRDITREEFSALAVKLYEKLTGKTATAAVNPFTDTKNTEVLKAFRLKIITGKTTTLFYPGDKITRQEIAVMLTRTLNAAYPGAIKDKGGTLPFADRNFIASWALESMQFVYNDGIMNGYSATRMEPLKNTSREQAIALVKRTYEKYRNFQTATQQVPVQPEPAAPSATTVPVVAGTGAYIDTSQKDKGLVRVGYKGAASDKMKVMVSKGSTTYYYPLKPNGVIEGFPLQLGNGQYKVSVLKNISGTQYSYVKTETFSISLSDPNIVYLNSIQTINWNSDSAAAKKNSQLAGSETDPMKRITSSYDFIVKNVVYNYDKIKGLSSDYTPSPDETLRVLNGICYDYSSLFAAMKRSEGVPIKLVKGYNRYTDVYHAWNEVYINGKWVVVDTTFDAIYYQNNQGYSFQKNSSDYTKIYEY
jgi:hypothetical protein